MAAATAGQDEDPPLPGPPIGRRAVCSRPYFMVLMVFAHLYVFSVLGLLLFVHISADDGDPDPTKDSPSPAQGAPASAPAGSSAYALPRLEGIKASTSRHRAGGSAPGAALRAPPPADKMQEEREAELPPGGCCMSRAGGRDGGRELLSVL